MLVNLKSTFLLVVSGLILVTACDKEESYPTALTFKKKSESVHFEYYYDAPLTADLIEPLEKALEDGFDSITTQLSSGPMPKIRIAIWSDKNEFEATMNNKYPGAAGYVNGREEVRVLYTGSPQMLKGVVHEFVHVVTLFLADEFANNPRWLWEAVAQYQSGSFVDPKTQPYLVNSDFPTMEVLSNEKGSQRIYPLGYTIAEYIVEKWGYEGLQSLIKKYGDTEKAFGITITDFEQQWEEFVKNKYLM